MRILSLCLLMACFACGTEEATSPSNDSAETTDQSQNDQASDDTATDNSDAESDNETSTPETTDTDPTEEDINHGSSPSSCGSPDQGLEPVDCTAHGDVNSFCVFSNHCHCSVDEGFECEEESDWGSNQECAPGSSCVPTPQG